MTVVLALLAAAIGVVLGVLLAVMRLSESPVLRLQWLYTWLLRGTPLLVQILIWGNLGAVPCSLSIPFGPLTGDTNTLITPFARGVSALGLNEGAYMAEIVRAGHARGRPGPGRGRQALGMTAAPRMRRIVLPQAMRVIIPPAGNQFISLLKTTSLVSVIADADLLTPVAEHLAAQLPDDRAAAGRDLLVPRADHGG